jgi:hypothetical protein
LIDMGNSILVLERRRYGPHAPWTEPCRNRFDGRSLGGVEDEKYS